MGGKTRVLLMPLAETAKAQKGVMYERTQALDSTDFYPRRDNE